jgi:hypothetical protein
MPGPPSNWQLSGIFKEAYMQTSPAFTLDQFCLALQQQAAGLYYLSESEYPFEAVSFPYPEGQSYVTADILQLAGQPPGTPMETVSLADFFRSRTHPAPAADAETVRMAKGLGQLQAFLEQQLQGVQVYRIGRRKIAALILGQLPGQGFAGLKTWVVET